MAARNPYIAIMRAAARGQGLHLTFDEVCTLSMDDAIATYAANCLSLQEAEGFGSTMDEWARIDPRKDRVPANYATGGKRP